MDPTVDVIEQERLNAFDNPLANAAEAEGFDVHRIIAP